MHTIELSADEIVSRLLRNSDQAGIFILDSCGVGHLGSHLLIAGVAPVEVTELSCDDPKEILATLDKAFDRDLAAIFTLSYEFGEKLNGIAGRDRNASAVAEPGLFLSLFDSLVVHDYDTGITKIVGNQKKFDIVEECLTIPANDVKCERAPKAVMPSSNFSRPQYLTAIEIIKERIRCGNTYQTNLTQQISARLSDGMTPPRIFRRLRREHPAPFAAFMRRNGSTVISASPERFFRISSSVDRSSRRIETSPIKGTRPRGTTDWDDNALRTELLASVKDRAENTMIVDLLRNDLGRVCQYGSVRVEKLCDLEEHPTLFHLVSTVSGELRGDVKFSEILTALFPCGSITGAPKISTMRIINEIESVDRGLSMGAIGYHIPNDVFGMPAVTDLSVAIRTMVVRDNVATFNVGGGIVIDSDPEKEFEESLLKAKALLQALGVEPAASNDLPGPL